MMVSVPMRSMKNAVARVATHGCVLLIATAGCVIQLMTMMLSRLMTMTMLSLVLIVLMLKSKNLRELVGTKEADGEICTPE